MSDTPIDPMRDLVEEYALGLLDDAERTAFEARLAVDADLRREVAATQQALGELALSTPADPAPALKNRVMERIAVNAADTADGRVLPLAPRVRSPRTAYFLGAALAASLMLVVKLAADLRSAERAAATAHADVATRERALAQRDSLIDQLTDATTEAVTLAATGDAKPLIRAFISRQRGSLTISATQLETLPPGRAYQLWFIVDGKAIPSVTFTADSAGRALVRGVPMPAGAVAATAITEEPEGGSPAPTTKVTFYGKLATE